MSLVYIGCGSDFEPVVKLPEVNEFIYIDSQPQSEYGWLEYGTKYFYRKNYSYEFIKNLPTGFFKINIEHTYPDVYHDCLLNRTIYHYYSLPFPWTSKIFKYHVTKKDIDYLKCKISQATHLAIIGHDPHAAILELLPPKFALITNDRTVYPKNEAQAQEGQEGDGPTVASGLVINKIVQRRITSVKCLTTNGDTVFDNYDDFLHQKQKQKEK